MDDILEEDSKNDKSKNNESKNNDSQEDLIKQASQIIDPLESEGEGTDEEKAKELTEDLNSENSKAKLNGKKASKKNTKIEEDKVFDDKEDKVKRSQTHSSLEENKDEKNTSVPNEEEPIIPKEEPKDEEEEEKKADNIEQIPSSTEVPKDQVLEKLFEALDDFGKQWVVDHTLDSYLSSVVQPSFGFHGYVKNEIVQQEYV
jgi:hypothetical protein